MKTILLALLVACGGAAEPTTTTPTKTETQPILKMACGDTACTSDQICIETQVGPGTPPPDGESHITTDYRCAKEPQTGGGFGCDAVKDRHQRCIALIPAAPPHN